MNGVPSPEELTKAQMELLDRMVEQGWLVAYIHREGELILKFTTDGTVAARLLRNFFFNGAGWEQTQAKMLAFGAFIEKTQEFVLEPETGE